jgi:hypothetical protein
VRSGISRGRVAATCHGREALPPPRHTGTRITLRLRPIPEPAPTGASPASRRKQGRPARNDDSPAPSHMRVRWKRLQRAPTAGETRSELTLAFLAEVSRADLCMATHPSVSLDEAGARFRHLGALRRALGINGSRSSENRTSSERRGLRLGRSLLAQGERQACSPLTLRFVALRSSSRERLQDERRRRGSARERACRRCWIAPRPTRADLLEAGASSHAASAYVAVLRWDDARAALCWWAGVARRSGFAWVR